MASFPDIVKEWQTPLTVRLAAQATITLQSSEAIVAMKNAFLAPPLNPTILRGCSDGSGSFSTTVDLIVDTTDIVAATSGNHSWIWLEHPSGVQVVLDFNQANNQSITFVTSIAAGFTGGSATARPTAADENAAAGRIWFSGGVTGNYQLILNHSADGLLTYAFILFEGAICSQWMIGVAEPTHDAWDGRIASVEGSNSTSAGSNLNFFNTYIANSRIVAYAASGTMLLVALPPVSRSQDMRARYESLPAANGSWFFWEIYMGCVTAPRRGVHGRLPDLFWMNRNTPVGFVFRARGNHVNALLSIGHGLAIRWEPDMAPKVF